MSQTQQSPPVPRVSWPAVLGGIVFLVAGVALAGVLLNRGPKTNPDDKLERPTASLADQIQESCAACHEYPSPKNFPRWAWKKEIEQAYGFIRQFKPEMKPPPMREVTEFFENKADLELPEIVFEYSKTPFGIKYDKIPSPLSPSGKRTDISNVQIVTLDKNRGPEILATHMSAGLIMTWKPDEKSWKVLCDTIPHPAKVEVLDLDGDGRLDLIVANLGTFPPSDDENGSVVWLRGMKDGTFKAVPLIENLGRVSDVRAAEFRKKGVLDLVVGVFGWRKAGELILLENETTDWEKPRFVRKQLDKRHGAIHVPVADLNGDGKPDFVVLLAQEHERVEAFINNGDGTFTSKLIYKAPDPGYGSSGIQLVDMNGDGKLDVLYTNGDVMDAPHLLKPFHGIRWLENTGTYPYKEHLVGKMYGVHAAHAADLRGTGKMDVIAVAYLPEMAFFPARKEKNLDAIAIFEQVEPGKFTRHALESVVCDHVTVAVGDLYGSKRKDLVIGNFLSPGTSPPVQIWKNLGR